jgi:Uma2 family endonuclease
MSTKTLMTVEQFAQMPRDEAVHFELVEGELIPVASSTPEHAWIRDRLMVKVSLFLDREKLGIVLAARSGTASGVLIYLS